MASDADLLPSYYRIERPIGRGAFGDVFLVRDTRTNRPKVVKFVSGEEGAAAIQREMHVAASVRHENLVEILDVGTDARGRIFLVREWIEGASLQELLATRRLSVPEIVALGIAIASALCAIHTRNVIHRDLKPSNILVPRDEAGRLRFEQAKLSDFGLAGMLERFHEREELTTIGGELFGTPMFMSPEQVRVEPLTAAADVYGLGAVLYMTLCGRPPFQGSSVANLFQAILSDDEPAFPVAFGPIDDVLRRALAKDPTKRYFDGCMLMEALRALAVPAPVALAPVLAEAREAKASSDVGEITLTRAPSVEQRAVSPYVSWLAILCFTALVSWLIMLFSDGAPGLARVLGGIVLLTCAAALGVIVHALLRSSAEKNAPAHSVLAGNSDRDVLTQSLAMQVDGVLAHCADAHQRIFATSIALSLKDYNEAKTINDRAAALKLATDLMEKISERTTPWYVRHQVALTLIITAIAAIPGIVQMLQGFRDLTK